MMANLTEISVATRKIAIWLVVLFVGFIILRLIAGVILNSLFSREEPPPPPPDVRFNKLPKPNFPESFKSSSGLQFSLENVSGSPPETSPSGKVYRMPKKLPSFLAPDNAKKLAQKLGFLEEPEINSVYYFFRSSEDPLYTLQIDSVNLNYQLKYNYSENPEIFTSGQITSDDIVENEVKTFLQSYAPIDDSLLKGNRTLDYLKFNSAEKQLTGSTSLSNSQAVRLNLFREDIDNLKVVTPNFFQSFNYVMFAPTNNSNLKNILEVVYTFWPIAVNDFATYPLISAAQAYEFLTSGSATVANIGFNSDATFIIIRNIYLAYYDTEEPQQYLQPVFVFEGDNNFVAYYPAISSEYLE